MFVLASAFSLPAPFRYLFPRSRRFPVPAEKSRPFDSYGYPLPSFANRGQLDCEVSFLTRVVRGAVFVMTCGEVVSSLFSGGAVGRRRSRSNSNKASGDLAIGVQSGRRTRYRRRSRALGRLDPDLNHCQPIKGANDPNFTSGCKVRAVATIINVKRTVTG